MNPWWHLKHLPWRSLILTSGLTVLVVLILEAVLVLAAGYIPGVGPLLEMLFSSGLGNLTQIGVAMGIGAGAVLGLESIDRASITTRSLWGLILCLGIAFLLRKLVPTLPWLIDIGYVPLVGIALGVFWKGGSYWRSSQRW